MVEGEFYIHPSNHSRRKETLRIAQLQSIYLPYSFLLKNIMKDIFYQYQ
jgi:hypothetical protein